MEEEYSFLRKQHIGNPSKAIVKENETVKRGQMIAMQQGLGAPLHSSINGIVKKVTDEKIVIQKTPTDFSVFEPLRSLSPLEKIEEAGIVGLGGAGFPTAEKLRTNLSKEGTCIINAAECEPVLTHNLARIEKEPEKLVRGLEIMMDILQISHGVIAIKQKHEKAIQLLQKEIQKKALQIELAPLADLYPMGEERAIIREVKNRLLQTDELPSKADCVVVNAETAIRITEAVDESKPFLDKDMTIAGKLKKNAAVEVLFDVAIGRTMESVLNQAGGIMDSYGELIEGGPFTGHRTYLSEPVKKTTGGIIVSECFKKTADKIGILVCACGASKERMLEMAKSMDSEVVKIEYCKQAIPSKNGYKCENPGHCPGQVQKILEIKKAKATGVLIGNCSDCSNTVMSCAPKLGLRVLHVTDGALRAVNHSLIRKLN